MTREKRWFLVVVLLLAVGGCLFLLLQGAAPVAPAGPEGEAAPGPPASAPASRPPGEASAPRRQELAAPAGDGVLAPAWQEGLGGVRGRVVEHDGAPAAGLDVEAIGDLFPVLYQAGREILGGPEEEPAELVFARTRTDGDGGFRLRGFIPGDTAALHLGEDGESLLTFPLPDSPPPGGEVDLGEIRLPEFATVTGRVAAGGEPVAGATVWLSYLPGIAAASGLLDLRGGEWLLGAFGDQGARRVLFRAPAALSRVRRQMAMPEALTDGEGCFTFRRVHAGTCSVVAEKPGYQPGRATSLPVRAGRTRDAGTLRLDRENEVAVLVREADGEPAAGLEVMAGAMPLLVPVAVMRPLGRTDAGGRARGTGFSEGKVYVAARRPGRAWAVAGPFSHGEEMVLALARGTDLVFRCVAGEEGREQAVQPSRAELRSALDRESLAGHVRMEPGGKVLLTDLPDGAYQLLVTVEGTVSEQEFLFLPLPEAERDEPRILRFQTGHFLEVLVRDGAGIPVAGARLQASGLEQGFLFFGRGKVAHPLPRPVFTDGEGRARLGPLPAGEEKIGVWHPRHGARFVEANLPAAGPLQVVLAQGRIEGRVEPASPPGGGRWQVVVGGESPSPARMLRPAPDGAFALAMPPGRWQVVLFREWPLVPVEALFFAMATDRIGPEAEEGVEVQAGQTAPVVLRARGLEGAAGAVEGVVRQAGRPAPGVEVVARSGGRRQRAVTAGDGTYAILSIPPGRIQIAAGVMNRGFEGELRPLQETELELLAGGRVRQDFEIPAGSIQGTVVDERGRPLPAVMVRAEPRAASEEGGPFRRRGIDALTDGEGRFEMTHVAPGEWRLTVKGENCCGRDEPVLQVPAAGPAPPARLVALLTVPVTLLLEPPPPAGSRLHGLRLVPIGGGAPVERPAWRPEREIELHLGAGTWRVEAWEGPEEGGAWAVRAGQVTVPERPAGPLRVLLAPAAGVFLAPFSGRLVDGKGRPLGPGTLVIHYWEGAGAETLPGFMRWRWQDRCQVGGDGAFSTQVPPGDLNLGFQRQEKERQAPIWVRQEVPREGLLGIEIRFTE